MNFERVARTVLAYASLTGGTVVFGGAAGVCGIAGRVDLADRCAAQWSRMLLASFGVRVEAHGLEHAVGLGPTVILSSHRSHLDGPLLLASLPMNFSIVIKRSLAQIPVWGWAATHAGYISIDRRDHGDALSGMRRAAEVVRAGRRVLVFPEGSRSKTGDFNTFKKGGAVLAIEAQAPILPVAIAGTAALLPPGANSARSGRAVMCVGRPIPTTGATYEDRDRVLAEAEAAIKALYAEAEARLARK